MNLDPNLNKFALLLQDNHNKIKKVIIHTVHTEHKVPLECEIEKYLKIFSTNEATLLASLLLNVAGNWALELQTPEHKELIFNGRMGAITIAEAILKYGENVVSRDTNNCPSMDEVEKLIVLLYAAAVSRGDIGERTDNEWVGSVINNLSYKIDMLKELGKEYTIVTDYQEWIVRVFKRNQLLEKIYSWADQFMKENKIMPVLIPSDRMEEYKNWPGAVEAFNNNFESLLYKFFIFHEDKVYFSPAYVKNKIELLIINSVDDEKLLTKKLDLNLEKEDRDFLKQLKKKVSDMFEDAVGKKLVEIFGLSTTSLVKVGVEEIIYEGEVVYDNSTGGEIDCLVYLPEKEKLLVLELKNKALPTSLRMLNAQRSRFEDNSTVTTQLQNKINGLKIVLNENGNDKLKSLFPTFTGRISVETNSIRGAIITSYISTVNNEKYPVVSVSEMGKLVDLI